MAEKQETISDIIAAMRGGPIPQHRHDRMLLCHFADRLEAAHKRERGDCAKLREALMEIRKAMMKDSGTGPATELHTIIDAITQDAIAAPARNCDVGTPAEQTIRFKKFCIDNRAENDFGCGDCPCYSEDSDTDKCGILWAQMPYTEGGAK